MEEKITAWLARDENGELHIYTTRPFKVGGQWATNDDGIDINKFPQVKWKNKEPTKVELLIKVCE